MLSKLYLAAYCAFTAKVNTLNFTELKGEMNPSSKNERLHGADRCRWNEEAVERCWAGPVHRYRCQQGVPGDLRKRPRASRHLHSFTGTLLLWYPDLINDSHDSSHHSQASQHHSCSTGEPIFRGCHLHSQPEWALRFMTYLINTTAFPFQPTCTGTGALCSKAVTQLMTHSVMPSPSKLL